MRHITLFIILIIAMTACTSRDIMDRLAAAESILQEYPDSALALIQSIDSKDIRGFETSARYALALTAAQIKNDINVDDDSLINIAVDYYAVDTTSMYMRSIFYRGCVYQNTNKTHAAIKDFTDAEKIAIALDDNFFLGLIYRNLADMYDLTTISDDDKKYYRKSLDAFIRHGDEKYIRYALADLAYSYIDLKDYEKSCMLADSALRMSLAVADRACAAYSLNIKGNACNAMENFSLAIKLYEKIINEYPQSVNSPLFTNLSWCYFKIGDENKYDDCMKEAYLTMYSCEDSINYYYTRYRIDYLKHNDREAMNSLEKAVLAQNNLMHDMLSQSAAIAQRDYYKDSNRDMNLRLERMRHNIIVAIAIAFLLIIITLLYIRNRLSIKNLKIYENAQSIVELSRENEDYKQQSELYRQQQQVEFDKATNDNVNLSNSVAQSENMRDLIFSLFKKQIAAIEQISKRVSTLLILPPTNKKYKLLESTIKDVLIDIAPDDETFHDLERVVDSIHNDVIVKFRAEYPSFTERDYRLVCCFLAGFSASEIALFLKEDVNNIYRIKSRIKKRIAASDSIHKDIFIDMFS